jgi:hypothetical protein
MPCSPAFPRASRLFPLLDRPDLDRTFEHRAEMRRRMHPRDLQCRLHGWRIDHEKSANRLARGFVEARPVAQTLRRGLEKARLLGQPERTHQPDMPAGLEGEVERGAHLADPVELRCVQPGKIIGIVAAEAEEEHHGLQKGGVFFGRGLF